MHALSLHPPEKGTSKVAYNATHYYHVFRGTAAIDDSAGKAASPLTFAVVGDGKTLWKSRPLQQAGDREDCTIIISGVEVLELRVYCPGKRDKAHAVWLAPRFLE